MEIITYVLEGSLAHKDSMGNGSHILPGDVQRMSAGTGVTHSEYNFSKDEVTHLLQIWILPETKGIPPSYEQKCFSDEEKQNRLRLIASPDRREGSVLVHQNVNLYASILEPGHSIRYNFQPGRHTWIQVARGQIQLNNTIAKNGDGIAITDEDELLITGKEASEFLLFDLA
jgi:redox-sensitive bicupin YhaK (pirin superfamily)